MYCFRFFSSNQRLSSIRSLFEMFSEIIRVVSGCSAVNKDCPRFSLCLIFSAKLFVLFQAALGSTKTVLDSVSV